jgi:hypothetical protein
MRLCQSAGGKLCPGAPLIGFSRTLPDMLDWPDLTVKLRRSKLQGTATVACFLKRRKVYIKEPNISKFLRIVQES